MKSLPSLQVYTKILELIDTHSGGLSLSEIANLLDLPKRVLFPQFWSLWALQVNEKTSWQRKKCMYVKAWQNQGLQMRHWQIEYPFYKMKLQTNAEKEGAINYVSRNGRSV